MSHLSVGVVFTSQEWRPALQRYVRDHAVGVSLRLIRDSRMALEEHVDVLVVDDETSFLGPQFVAAVRERGGRTIGVYDPAVADDDGHSVLTRMGVDRLVPCTVSPEELLAEIEELGSHDTRDEFEAMVAGLGIDDGAERRRSPVVAVGGPPGAGATEVAVALSEVLSAHLRTVLVDVDEVAPGVARRLQLTLHPHLLTALDQLRGGGLAAADEPHPRPLEQALARPAVGRSRALGFDVIAGLANPRDWNLLQGDEVAQLLGEAAQSWECVVVNLGPHLEDLSRYVDRFAASRAAAARADHVVGVCEASPRGVLRFLDWLVDATELGLERPIVVVLNRAPRPAYLREELAQHLQEHAGSRIGSIEFLAEDHEVGRSAWDGVVVARGPFRQGVGALAQLLVPMPVASRRSLAWR